jgi:hypothetical protein
VPQANGVPQGVRILKTEADEKAISVERMPEEGNGNGEANGNGSGEAAVSRQASLQRQQTGT